MASTPSLLPSMSSSSSISSSKRPKPVQRRRPASPPSMYVAYSENAGKKAPRPLPERKPKNKDPKASRDLTASDPTLSRTTTSNASIKSGSNKSRSLFTNLSGGLRRKTSNSSHLSVPRPPPPQQRATDPFETYSRHVRPQASQSSLSSGYPYSGRPQTSESSLPSMSVFTRSSSRPSTAGSAWSRSDYSSRPSTAQSAASVMLPTPPEEERRRRQLTKANRVLGNSDQSDDFASPPMMRPTPIVVMPGDAYRGLSTLQPAVEEPGSLTPTNSHYGEDPYEAFERASYSSSIRLSPMLFNTPNPLPVPADPPSPIAVVAYLEDSSDSDGDVIHEVPVVPKVAAEAPAVATVAAVAITATSPATPTFATARPRESYKRHSKSHSHSLGHLQKPPRTTMKMRPDTPFADYHTDDGYATDTGTTRIKDGTQVYGAYMTDNMEYLAMVKRDAAVIRHEKRQNWSGEWNQDDMQEVIQKLRCLR